jgi:hypothetical protein
MSGTSSCIDAVKLINSDKQTPDDGDARFELLCVSASSAALGSCGIAATELPAEIACCAHFLAPGGW